MRHRLSVPAASLARHSRLVKVVGVIDNPCMTVSQSPQAGARHARHAGLRYGYDQDPGIRRRRRGRRFDYFDVRGHRIVDAALFDRCRRLAVPPAWTENLSAFGASLSAIRARVLTELARDQLDRDRVIAAIVRLLDRTGLRVMKALLTGVAKELGNTPTILKKSYIHPNLLDMWREGSFAAPEWQRIVRSQIPRHFSRTEALFLRWLRKRYPTNGAR